MRHHRSLSRAVVAMAALFVATSASAVPLHPVSYSMPNGDGQASGGSFNYWDRNYTGTGATTTDGAALVGGLGKLTDGVVATLRWDFVSDNLGTGLDVGWLRRVTPDPLITFSFASGITINSIDIQLDNSQVGGVFAPSAILIDGIARAFTAPTIGTVGDVVFTGLALTGSTHTVQFIQSGANWTFVSEIAFDGTTGRVVPEPSTIALLGLGLAGLAMRRRRG